MLNIEDDVSQKVMAASESTAAQIIKKMKSFREYIPTYLHEDLDWCINEIRQGHIY